MNPYVKAGGNEWPVLLVDEYRVQRGVPVVIVLIAGYPGVSQYRALTVPTSEVTFR